MKFTIYTQPRCGWCHKAVDKLMDLGKEISIRHVDEPTKKLFREAGLTTVPQIYVTWEDGAMSHIGGHDALVEWLEKNNVG